MVHRRASVLLPGFVLAVVACATTESASAQVLSQYFPATGTGVGEISEEPAQIKVDEAYAPLGLRLGGFHANAEVSEAIGYNNNVDALPGGVGSPAFSTAATTSVSSNWSQHRVFADASVSDLRYPSRSIQDQTNWTVDSGGFYDFGRDRLGGTYTHLDLVQTPTDLGSAATAQPIPYQVDQLALSYSLNLPSGFTLMPELKASRYSFDDSVIAPGNAPGNAGTDAISQSYRDRDVIVESLTGRYEISAATSALVVLNGTEIRYTENLAGFPGRDSNGYSVMTGVELKASRLVQVRLLAGFQDRFYRNALYANIATPILEAQIVWTPTRLTRVELAAQRGVEDSAYENVVGFTFDTVRLSVQHQYQRNIVLSGYLISEDAHYDAVPALLQGSALNQASGNQFIYGAGAELEWLVNRHLHVSANYNFSNQNVTSEHGRFSTHQVFLKFSFVL